LSDEFGASDLGGLLDIRCCGHGAQIRPAPGRAESIRGRTENHFGEAALGDQLGVVASGEGRGRRVGEVGGEDGIEKVLASAEPFTHRHREQFGEADSSRQSLRECPRRQEPGGTGEQVLASGI